MSEVYFTKEHEWIEFDGKIATIGLTEHASNELGEITFIELPEVGASLNQGDPIGVVESLKAAHDLYAPAGGSVLEVNEDLEDTPSQVNEDPQHDGWICKLENVKEEDLETLMTEDAYEDFTNSDEEVATPLKLDDDDIDA
ncbi:MAG: glycine cleavage system protein GcvH [Lentisphaeria bacterium]|nr:glycine cleavage system protein GcvH [Lentisphaeria bacterium]